MDWCRAATTASASSGPAGRRTTTIATDRRCWRISLPLANVPGVALLSLQKGPKTGQAGKYYGPAPLINIGAEIDDYDDTMAILEKLDLLVTVDTSVAHVAGAMGRPVWIMLPRAPDWRWLLDRTDTPWYPTVRLFRQQTVRQWGDVAKTIAADLAQHDWQPDSRRPSR